MCLTWLVGVVVLVGVVGVVGVVGRVGLLGGSAEQQNTPLGPRNSEHPSHTGSSMSRLWLVLLISSLCYVM